MLQYEIKVSGRVQGVGFRYFVQHKANEFGIKGWVKNTIDNDVLIMAQGDEIDIKTFIDFLYIGPTLSRVDTIIKQQTYSKEKFENFEIRV